MVASQSARSHLPFTTVGPPAGTWTARAGTSHCGFTFGFRLETGQASFADRAYDGGSPQWAGGQTSPRPSQLCLSASARGIQTAGLINAGQPPLPLAQERGSDVPARPTASRSGTRASFGQRWLGLGSGCAQARTRAGRVSNAKMLRLLLIQRRVRNCLGPLLQ